MSIKWWTANWQQAKDKIKKLTFSLMSSHWVPLPEAGAPDIIIFKGSTVADANTYSFVPQQNQQLFT